jgi:signal transduction histidine kinase
MADAQQQAREKLAALIESAHKGAIIPVRLPGQLEEIAALMESAEEEAAAAKPPPPSPDLEQVIQDHAEFVSVAVHELRTPMTSIRGYSDMMNTPAMGELNDMQKQFLDTIRTNTKRMEGLLQDVSDLGKLRGGTLKLTEKMDMFKNIAGIVQKDTEPLAEEMGKTLAFDIPQGLPLLTTDGEYFAKAIAKLIENGLRYSGEDGEVSVSARGEDSWLVVEVTDNGIGMSPEELNQLGTLFWRSEREEVREHKGSGMGIPIAFGVFDMLGAKYTVESALGEGTAVTIQIKGMT